MKSKSLALAFVGAATLGSAALTGRKIDVALAGRTLWLDSVVVGGKTYVSLDGLKAGLAAPGGANAMAATEGAQGEWLFNGAWRFRVTKVEWNATNGFWDVSITLRNGTRQTRHVGGNGLDPTPSNAFHLTTESGNALGIPLGTLANGLQVEIGYKDLPPGGGVDAVLHFPGGKADDRPVKLIAEFTAVPGLGFVKNPSLRIDLKG